MTTFQPAAQQTRLGPLPPNRPPTARRDRRRVAFNLILAGTLVIVAFAARGASQVRGSPNPIRDSLTHPEALPAASRDGDRYVSPSGSDSNDGTQQHPWVTINHAGSVVSPGMIVHVATGVYVEAVATTVSGTSNARIIYISDQAWGAVIIAPGRDGFAWKNTGSYSDIIGFEIAGSRCGGIGLGGSFQRAVSNHVHNSAAGCDSSNGGSGINDFDYAGRGNHILRNYVHDVGINEPSCGQPRHSYIHGIYQANAGGHIDHNISANNCGWGIHLWHAATHATITNNTVVANKAGGIVIGSGDAPCTTTGCPGGNDFTTVANNIVAYNGNPASGGWGLGQTAQDPGRTGIHNEYSHNLSFQNMSGDFYLPPSLACRNCITGRDPRFVSMSSGDYRLRADSPAIRTGKSEEATSPKSVDIGALPHVTQ